MGDGTRDSKWKHCNRNQIGTEEKQLTATTKHVSHGSRSWSSRRVPSAPGILLLLAMNKALKMTGSKILWKSLSTQTNPSEGSTFSMSLQKLF